MQFSPQPDGMLAPACAWYVCLPMRRETKIRHYMRFVIRGDMYSTICGLYSQLFPLEDRMDADECDE